MRFSVVPLIISSISLLLSSCDQRFINGGNFEQFELQGLAPAKDAAEWTERFSKSSNNWSPDLELLYAQLPPEEHWPTVIKALEENKLDNQFHDNDEKEKIKQQRIIFASLLKGSDSHTDALEAYKTILKTEGEIRHYKLKAHTRNLIQLGLSAADTKAFLKPLLKKESTKSPPKPWEEPLAQGKVEEGIKLLREETQAAEERDRTSAWKKLLRIATVLKMAPLQSECLEALEKEFTPPKSPYEYISLYQFDSLLKHHHEAGNWQKLYDLIKPFAKNRIKNPDDHNNFDQLLPYYLLAKSKTEGPAKESAALLEAFKELPLYGVETPEQWLSFLDDRVAVNSDLFIALLEAYQKNEQGEQALHLLQYLLPLNNGHDPYYEKLINQYPAEAPAILTQLRAFDPFEERPLIWLAHLALKNNETAKARALVEEAIKLDPSDGEQGKETRMEAYNVLSMVFAAEGNAEQATFFKEVMLAIREGEVADDFLYAGLDSHAIDLYTKALGHFSDAYCLQSRLAKAHLESKNIEKAKIHFEKAFSLMPVSFGPVESHCFGCEGIFKDPLSQQIAERVFKEIISKSPENPRTYYLIGLLYQEQKKHTLALDYFLKAFEKDAQYYNCALQILSHLYHSPEAMEKHPDILKQIYKIIPYAELPERFSHRIDLAQNWRDAQKTAANTPNPLHLPKLPLPFLPSKDPQSSDSSYQSNAQKSLDGWTAQELLQDNAILSQYF